VVLNQVVDALFLDALVYAPFSNATGQDTFDYAVEDGNSAWSVATGVVTVTLNTPPVAGLVIVVTNKHTAYTFQWSDFSSVCHDPYFSSVVGIEVTQPPAHGTLTYDSGAMPALPFTIMAGDIVLLVYTPEVNFTDTDVGMQYRAFDGYATSTAAANVFVRVNALPVADSITVHTNENTPLTFTKEAFSSAFHDSFYGSFAGIRVTALPSGGVLRLAAAPFPVGQYIDADSIASLVYTPTANTHGTFSDMAYEAFDTLAYSAAVTVVIIVNAPPVAADVAVLTNENIPYVFLLADFTNAFSDPYYDTTLKSITLTHLGDHGTLTINGQPVAVSDVINAAAIPTLTYTAAVNFTGVDYRLRYTVSDGWASSLVAAAITITVNAPPVAGDFTVALNENSAHTFVWDNFSPFCSDPFFSVVLGINVTALPSDGSLTLGAVPVHVGQYIPVDSVGTLVYTPTAGFYSTDSAMRYVTYDGHAYSIMSAAITFDVNALPVSGDFTVRINENSGYTFSWEIFNAVCSDSYGGAIAGVGIIGLPAHGTLTLNSAPITIPQPVSPAGAGKLVYTPTTGFYGNDTGIKFVAWDGITAGTVESTVTVAVNALPVVANLMLTTKENTAYRFKIADFAACTDPDGQITKYRITRLPAHGQLAYSGTTVQLVPISIPASDIETLVYTPANYFDGTDAGIQFAVEDGFAYSSGIGTITFTVEYVNRKPSATGIVQVSMNQGSAYAFNATQFSAVYRDLDGDAFAGIKIVSTPGAADGTLSLGSSPVAAGQAIAPGSIGSLSFHAAATYRGTTGFQWSEFDGVDYSDPVGCVITVNSLPTITGTLSFSLYSKNIHSFTYDEFNALYSDIETPQLQGIKILTQPASSSIQSFGAPVTLNTLISPARILTLTYVPAPEYSVNETFTWSAYDGMGYSAVSTARVTVHRFNTPPVLSPITLTGQQNTDLNITLENFTSHFYDSDGDTLTSIYFDTVPHSTAGYLRVTAILFAGSRIPANYETLRFEPSDDWVGTTSFLVSVSDGFAYSAPANFTITIEKAPPPPPPPPGAAHMTTTSILCFLLVLAALVL
jgi:hypothetical protein